MRLHPFFSYYGAKWRASRYYSAPIHDTIIEPFAGSACYSLLHHKKNVILVDADPTISELWTWLIEAKESDIRTLPDKVDDISNLDVHPAAKSLIGFWFVKGSAVPVTRPYAWARTGQWNNQFWGQEIKDRICKQLQYVRHWKIISGDYRLAGDVTATWFIDPPYQGAGKHYKYKEIDYKALAEWCKTREGQVIVCEQKGADWLDFKDFKKFKALKSRQSEEMVYEQGGQHFGSVRW